MKKIKSINLNTVAKMISELEGKKVNLPIAQIKEVLKVLLDLADKNPSVYYCLFEAILKKSYKRQYKKKAKILNLEDPLE